MVVKKERVIFIQSLFPGHGMIKEFLKASITGLNVENFIRILPVCHNSHATNKDGLKIGLLSQCLHYPFQATQYFLE